MERISGSSYARSGRSPFLNTTLSYVFGGASLSDFIILKEDVKILEPKFSIATETAFPVPTSPWALGVFLLSCDVLS